MLNSLLYSTPIDLNAADPIMKKALSLSFMALTLTGCFAATARVAVLQNPETKQTVECKITPVGGMNWTAQVDNCIAAYQKAGYVVVADTGKQ